MEQVRHDGTRCGAGWLDVLASLALSFKLNPSEQLYINLCYCSLGSVNFNTLPLSI